MPWESHRRGAAGIARPAGLGCARMAAIVARPASPAESRPRTAVPYAGGWMACLARRAPRHHGKISPDLRLGAGRSGLSTFDPRNHAAGPDELGGRVIAITGAGDGLGRAVALACARCAANVILVGRNSRKLEAVHAEIERAGG